MRMVARMLARPSAPISSSSVCESPYPVGLLAPPSICGLMLGPTLSKPRWPNNLHVHDGHELSSISISVADEASTSSPPWGYTWQRWPGWSQSIWSWVLWPDHSHGRVTLKMSPYSVKRRKKNMDLWPEAEELLRLARWSRSQGCATGWWRWWCWPRGKQWWWVRWPTGRTQMGQCWCMMASACRGWHHQVIIPVQGQELMLSPDYKHGQWGELSDPRCTSSQSSCTCWALRQVVGQRMALYLSSTAMRRGREKVGQCDLTQEMPVGPDRSAVDGTGEHELPCWALPETVGEGEWERISWAMAVSERTTTGVEPTKKVMS